MDTGQWNDLPLFPLNTVLFPGMVLPLHIFEERYKVMVERCMEEKRVFGVLLIREGKEVGGHALPYTVGTTSAIASVTRLKGGGFDVVSVGIERFRLHAIRHHEPYLVGDAEPWPLEDDDSTQAERQAPQVQALFRHYLDQLIQAQGHRIEIDEMPADPLTLALLVAMSLQLPLVQKQYLLTRHTLPDLFQAERAIMRREQLLLNHIIQTQADQWEGGYSGYLARN
jgi:Lon protease-like protein